MEKKYDVLIIGSGLSGVVIAERFVNKLNKKVLIIEKREHIGGNIYVSHLATIKGRLGRM
jgi:UDP-galactopyranose mutase